MTTKSEALARVRTALKKVKHYSARTSIPYRDIYIMDAISALADALEAEDAQPEPMSEWRRSNLTAAYQVSAFGGEKHSFHAGLVVKLPFFCDRPWLARDAKGTSCSHYTEADALAWLGVPDAAAQEMLK